MRSSRSSATPCTTWRMLPNTLACSPQKLRNPGSGAHAAEEAITLGEQHRGAVLGRGGSGGDACRSTAQYNHIELTEERYLAGGLGNGLELVLTHDVPPAQSRVDVVLLDDRLPARHVRGQHAAEFCGCVGHRVHVLQPELLLDRRLSQDLHEFAMQSLDNGLRGLRRHDEPDPCIGLDVLHARFGKRRQVGQRRGAVWQTPPPMP